MENFNSSIIYILTLVIASFSMLAIAVLVLYFRLLQRYHDLKKIVEKETGIVNLEETNKKAKLILEEARIRAGEILTNTNIFTTNQRNILIQELTKSSQIYAKQYQDSLKFAQDEAVRAVERIPSEIKVDLMAKLTKFGSVLEQELVNSQKILQESIRESYSNAEKEVENYKLVRLKQVDASIMKVVEDVTRDVLAKELSADEHEKLVIKALEVAKSQNFFDIKSEKDQG